MTSLALIQKYREVVVDISSSIFCSSIVLIDAEEKNDVKSTCGLTRDERIVITEREQKKTIAKIALQ